jgi:cytoskeletal protein RodZ
MSNKDTQEKTQSLGAFLREHREQKGASLTEVTEVTKISLPVLKAIEEDKYDRLPAEPFSRGFYSLYADFLELDPKKIIERYEASTGQEKNSRKKQANPPVKKNQRFTNYAEPSSISPATSMTIFTAVCLIIVAGICWYFNWTPGDYIDTKLIPPQPPMEQQQTQPVQQVPTGSSSENKSAPDITNKEETVPPETFPVTVLSETNDEMSEELPKETQAASPAGAPYHLEIHFSNSGTLKVTLDDGFVLNKHFSAGETLQWKVEEKIILDMPETISGTLRLNGIDVPLPKTKNGRRILSLPEDLLD